MDSTLGSRIREARKRKGLSQEALARELKISVGTVSKYERDEVDPHTSKLKAVAAALDTTTSALVGDDVPGSEGEAA